MNYQDINFENYRPITLVEILESQNSLSWDCKILVDPSTMYVRSPEPEIHYDTSQEEENDDNDNEDDSDSSDDEKYVDVVPRFERDLQQTD
jgi:hypothetical protein